MENKTDILNFEVEIYGDVLNDGSKPIFNDDPRELLGGFTIKAGSVVACSVPLKGNPYSLHFTSGIPFYFTPMEGEDGKISHALISEVPIKPYSVKVQVSPQ